MSENFTPTAPKYIPVINSLRGLASIAVCISHFISQPLNFFDHNSLAFQYSWLGTLGVQVFFVITGIVIPIALINGKYNYRKFGKFILKRIIRIEPPYLFSILIGILFIVLKSHLLSKNLDGIPSIKTLLLHIGYLIPFVKGQVWFIGVYWTLAIEFQFYILISLIFPLLINNKFIIRLTCYILVFGLATTFTNTALAPVWLPIFMMGIIYINFRSKIVDQLEFWVVLFAAISFSLFLHNVPMTIAAVSTLAVIHFFSYHQSKVGNFFGDISYSLYLIHMIFGVGIVNIMVPHTSQLYSKLLVVLLGFIVSIISAYIFYLVIEKPSKKYASKISLKDKKAVITQDDKIITA